MFISKIPMTIRRAVPAPQATTTRALSGNLLIHSKRGGGGKGGGKGGGGKGSGKGGGGKGRGQGDAGGWPSTTGNPSGGGRSNNPPQK